jgi:hypothetical protein
MTADDKWLADHFSVISVGAPMKRQPFDVVAYTFHAALVCPGCIVGAVAKAEADNPLGVGVPAGLTAEKLAILAERLGVDRMDESSYDSGDFPKVVFRDQLADADLEGCEVCGADLTRQ